MEHFVHCCRIPPPLNPERQQQGHSLITSSSGQSEMKQIIEHNRHARWITALLNVNHLPFKAMAVELSGSSSMEDDLERIMLSPSRRFAPGRPVDNDSDDEGGVTGEIDSMDST
jgi:hypothetical protein